MTDNTIATQPTALTTVPGWNPDQLARLKQSWIDTAEQVVAVASTSNGLQSLAAQIGATEDEMRELVTTTREILSPSVRGEMEEGVDTSVYGLGVRRPPQC